MAKNPEFLRKMRRIDSLLLGEFPLDFVRIECERSSRVGSCRRDGLVARFGADIALPDLLVALASWERRADFSKACGARFTDLVNQEAHQQDR
jgi:hypothetical protein